MAFYGPATGVTNIVTPYQNTTNTSSDRSLSGSWVTHLSINSLTVPSGHYGVFDCFCYSYCWEESNGGAEFKFSHTGSSSADGHVTRFKRGFEGHDGGDNTHFDTFHLGAGTYNFQWNAREWTGGVVLNREQNYDYFGVNHIVIRD
jgi:hypothetical protein